MVWQPMAGQGRTSLSAASVLGERADSGRVVLHVALGPIQEIDRSEDLAAVADRDVERGSAVKHGLVIGRLVPAPNGVRAMNAT